MTSHQWKKDKDGAESCSREGCTVRRNARGMWQKKKGGRWWHAVPLYGMPKPLPPCTGKDVDVHAEHCTMDACKYGDHECSMRPRLKPAPSPLEVVLNKMPHALDCSWLGARKCTCHSGSAVATLEESIRRDERTKCAASLECDPPCPGECDSGCVQADILRNGFTR